MIKRLVKVVIGCQSVLLYGNAVVGTMYGMKRLAYITSVFLILVVMFGGNVHARDEDTSSTATIINSEITPGTGILIVLRKYRHTGKDRVFVDGIFRGSTRLEIELPRGKHSIRVEQDGFEPDEWTVDLGERRTTWAVLKPEKEKELPTTEAGMLEYAVWMEVRDSDDPELIDEFLRKFPDGYFAVVAKKKLEDMGESRSSAINPLIPDLDYGNFYALVIGNNQYKYYRDLKTAVNDARAVAHMLESNYGFNVMLLTNTTRSAILGSIKNLRHQVSSGDNVLVYYAGHGYLDSETDEGFWLPVDADPQDESNWLLTDRVRSKIKVMPAKHVLVVADSCFSGKFTRSVTRGFRIEPDTSNYVPGLKRLSTKRSRTVLTSGGLEPVLDSIGNSKHSVFAEEFLSLLNTNKVVLDAASLSQIIRLKVISNSSQTPEYGPIYEAGHDGGDFLFVRR